ncbi:MAG TPA: hypothetical protein VLW53_03840 [Candidatus Eisenbacteria bacterium]|nr:hypothetical protein [Candidatus Eisenbacteria bacterium]
MAAPKKPASGSKARSTRSGGAGGKASSTKANGKAPAKRSGRATAKPAEAKASATGKTASVAKAEATAPSLRPGRRRGRAGRVVAVIGVLVAAAVAVILLVSGGGSSSKNSSVAATTPTTIPTVTTPPATAPAVTTPTTAAPAVAPPTGKPAVRVQRCAPIIGSGASNSGKSYPVTSTAKDGGPAPCGEAHSVLLAALNGASTGGWHCTTQPSGSTIATCTSTGGRTIRATG